MGRGENVPGCLRLRGSGSGGSIGDLTCWQESLGIEGVKRKGRKGNVGIAVISLAARRVVPGAPNLAVSSWKNVLRF